MGGSQGGSQGAGGKVILSGGIDPARRMLTGLEQRHTGKRL